MFLRACRTVSLSAPRSPLLGNAAFAARFASLRRFSATPAVPGAPEAQGTPSGILGATGKTVARASDVPKEPFQTVNVTAQNVQQITQLPLVICQLNELHAEEYDVLARLLYAADGRVPLAKSGRLMPDFAQSLGLGAGDRALVAISQGKVVAKVVLPSGQGDAGQVKQLVDSLATVLKITDRLGAREHLAILEQLEKRCDGRWVAAKGSRAESVADVAELSAAEQSELRAEYRALFDFAAEPSHSPPLRVRAQCLAVVAGCAGGVEASAGVSELEDLLADVQVPLLKDPKVHTRAEASLRVVRAASGDVAAVIELCGDGTQLDDDSRALLEAATRSPRALVQVVEVLVRQVRRSGRAARVEEGSSEAERARREQVVSERESKRKLCSSLIAVMADDVAAFYRRKLTGALFI